MTDAPERIWSALEEVGEAETSFEATYFGKCSHSYAGMSYATEYIRKDVSDELVAAERRSKMTDNKKDHLWALLTKRRENWISGIKDRARSIDPADINAMQELATRLQELDDLCVLLKREGYL